MPSLLGAIAALCLSLAPGLVWASAAVAATEDSLEARPFSPAADAVAQVDAALEAARAREVNAILVFGANWCHDSRGLAGRLNEDEALAALVQTQFALAYIDIGQRNHNLDQLARFGVPWVFGTPTVLIVSPQGELLNRDTVHDWRMAASSSSLDIEAYLQRYAAITPEHPAEIAVADLDAMVAQWPPLQAWLSEIAADDSLDAQTAERRRAYGVGFGRSMARSVIGDWSRETGRPVANSGDWTEPVSGPDLTAALSDRLNEITRIAPERYSSTGPDPAGP